jgi:DNA-binding CsgD family transcriptional regulator
VNEHEQLIRIAEQVCTEKELEALAYHLAGHHTALIALELGISRRAVTARIENAIRKIANHPDAQQRRPA